MAFLRKPAKKATAEAQHLDLMVKAFNLKKAGAGYRQIAATLGIGVAHAHRLVHEVMDEMLGQAVEDAKIYREEQWQRLEDLVLALQQKARKGDPASVDKLLRVLERQAALRGLDAPRKIAPTLPDGNPLPPPPPPSPISLHLLTAEQLLSLQEILKSAEPDAAGD